MADNVIPLKLSKRKTPKQLAKAFFDGTLTAEDEATMGEGMKHLIDLATTDNERATTAKRAALKDLADLADLAQDDDSSGVTHNVEIVHIKCIEGGVADLA